MCRNRSHWTSCTCDSAESPFEDVRTAAKAEQETLGRLKALYRLSQALPPQMSSVAKSGALAPEPVQVVSAPQGSKHTPSCMCPSCRVAKGLGDDAGDDVDVIEAGNRRTMAALKALYSGGVPSRPSGHLPSCQCPSCSTPKAHKLSLPELDKLIGAKSDVAVRKEIARKAALHAAKASDTSASMAEVIAALTPAQRAKIEQVHGGPLDQPSPRAHVSPTTRYPAKQRARL